MAYIDPKTNWKASDAPKASDLNRQENNIKYLHDEFIPESIAIESADRIAADSILQANINSEASTRATADGVLQTNINNEAITRASADSGKMTNAVIGNNGGVGSIVSITPSLVSGSIYRFTLPHSGIWICPALTSSATGFFSGSVFDVLTNASARTFWRIG